MCACTSPCGAVGDTVSGCTGSTVCALIFAGFNVRGFHGSAATREYFVREYLDVTVNGHVHSSSQSMTSCVTKIIGYGAISLR